MIDPNSITNFHRTKEELEEFWLFCIMVAGKQSGPTAKKVENILDHVTRPFVFLKNLDALGALDLHLKNCKAGQYNRILNALRDSFKVDLRTARFSDLIQIKGVGPKTAAFFLLHTRGEETAVLDTHILKYLKRKGHSVPKSTPQNLSYYSELSDLFKKEVASDPEYDTMTLAQADLEIWKKYAKSNL